MGHYFEPVLTEEQMAAYLDGMLSAEENNMIEELISSSPAMEEIQDAIDSVDSSYIDEYDTEIMYDNGDIYKGKIDMNNMPINSDFFAISDKIKSILSENFKLKKLSSSSSEI